MKKYLILIIAFIGLGSCSITKKQPFDYCNPITSLGFRDTHIIPDNGKYYAVGTASPYWEGSSPGIKLYVSDNLTDWTFDRLLIDAEKLDSMVWYKDRFWAPELRKIGTKYFLTFNCQNNKEGYGDIAKQKHFHACGVAISNHIAGPYKVMTHEEPLTPFASNDLTLFEDEDGKAYAFFNNGWTDLHHIYVAEFDTETCRLKNKPLLLISQEPGKWDGAGIEGAHVIKKDGIYYLFYSSWTRGYAVGYATATNITGPWKKYENNPLFGSFSEDDTTYLYKNGKVVPAPDCPLVGIGHNQIFIGPDGNYWTSYHGYVKGIKEAVTVIDPIWFENGIVKTNTPTYSKQHISF